MTYEAMYKAFEKILFEETGVMPTREEIERNIEQQKEIDDFDPYLPNDDRYTYDWE